MKHERLAYDGHSVGGWLAASALVVLALGCADAKYEKDVPADAGDAGDAKRISDGQPDAPVTPGACGPGAIDRSKGKAEACDCDRECQTGFCVDGLCCRSACGEPCRACDLPSSLGDCAVVPAGRIPSDPAECSPSTPSTCGRDGTCDGRGGCRRYVAGTECRPGQCDGDEDCVMLLLDGLINFSRSFLPETRGGTMDAPLFFIIVMDPTEIYKESHNLDVMASYPLDLYLAGLRYAHPREIVSLIDRVEHRLGTPAALEGFLYTHETSDISAGPLESTYTQLKTMIEKLEAELTLAEKIRAVDQDDVAERVLTTHFIRDLMGNLSAFSKQKLRCVKCNHSYRRMPLAGKCIRCGGNIIPTVHEGSVKKYLEVSRAICEKYRVSEYTKQRVMVLDRAMDSTFGLEKDHQGGLADFM